MSAKTLQEDTLSVQARDRVPLPRAAALLRWSWMATYTAMLRGDLDGVQAETGRWFVSRSSLDRLLAERQSA